MISPGRVGFSWDRTPRPLRPARSPRGETVWSKPAQKPSPARAPGRRGGWADGACRTPRLAKIGGEGLGSWGSGRRRRTRRTTNGSGPWEALPMMTAADPPRDEVNIAGFLTRIQSGDEGAARELLARYEAEVRLVVRRQLPRLLRSRFDSLDFLQ